MELTTKVLPERMSFCMLVMLFQEMSSWPLSLLADRSRDPSSNSPDHCTQQRRDSRQDQLMSRVRI
jgi:hypothetical protein